MNLSLLIKTLTAAKKQFGDIPVHLIDPESGHFNPIGSAMRLHPHTDPNGCTNRAAPVYGIALLVGRCHAKDLEINP